MDSGRAKSRRIGKDFTVRPPHGIYFIVWLVKNEKLKFRENVPIPPHCRVSLRWRFTGLLVFLSCRR